MLSALHSAARATARAFSTSSIRTDLSKLTLIGRLGRDPELKFTKNDKEFVSYTVATTNFPVPPPNPDGTRDPAKSSWHKIVSFSEHQNRYLMTLKKGSQVYVEANYELREAEPGADPSTPQGQKQIFLRHDAIRLISKPKDQSLESE